MKDSLLTKNTFTAQQNGTRKKILFANVPGDGHFNPLTGLAVHLKQSGYDVRWYSSRIFTERLQKLQIPHYLFEKAFDAYETGFENAFPERDAIKSKIKKLQFDLVNGFILRSTEYFEDIKAIHETFSFDMVIVDCAFMAIPFIKEKLQVPVISIGVMLGIQHQLPMVAAGVHEGKNEICARVGYFKIGINLRTELPSPEQLKKGIAEIMSDPTYKRNVTQLSKEFSGYQANNLCTMYVEQALESTAKRGKTGIWIR